MFFIYQNNFADFVDIEIVKCRLQNDIKKLKGKKGGLICSLVFQTGR